MTRAFSNPASEVATGAIAGLAGTLAMMAMRSFDERYSPQTVAKTREDPGTFMVRYAEHCAGVAGRFPAPLNKALAISTHLGYGTLAGVCYSRIRGRRRKSFSVLEGAAIGVVTYAVGHLNWLPLTGLSRPAWKQRFPEVTGELLRHVAFGVTAATVYGAIDARG